MQRRRQLGPLPRSVHLWHGLVILSTICSMVLGVGALGQTQGKRLDESLPLVIIEESQVLDDRLVAKGVTGRSIAETLHFAISSQPKLRSALVASGQAPPHEFKLSSTVYKIDRSTLWSGEIVGVNGKRGRIGPVAIMDDAGLIAGALSEIVTLIQSYVRQPTAAGARSIELSLDCFVLSGARAAQLLGDYHARLRRHFEHVSGVYWRDDVARKCSEVPSSLDEDAAVAGGWIDARDAGRILIRLC